MHRYQQRELRKTNNQAKMFQIKKHDTAPETDYKERELHDLPDTEFKKTVIKILTGVKGTRVNKVRISMKR